MFPASKHTYPKDYSNCSVKSFSIDSIVLNNGKLTRKFQS